MSTLNALTRNGAVIRALLLALAAIALLAADQPTLIPFAVAAYAVANAVAITHTAARAARQS